jgi:RimJ/RimL family protein N-acetyltransferase
VTLDLAAVDLTTAELRTGRLLLRPWRADDEDDLLAAWQDTAIQRFVLSVPVPATREAARAFLRDRAPAVRAELRGFNGAVEAGGRLVGSAGVYDAPRGRLGPELGYWTAPWARGRGYAAEIAGALSGWAFAHGAPRVHLFADVGNAASQAVARRAGFAEEGRVRAALADRDGTRRDALLFGRLP